MPAPLMRPHHTVPIFYVSDLARSLAYYQDVLGFSVDFRYGEPPFYAGIRLQGVELHITSADIGEGRRGMGAAYVMVQENLDDYFTWVIGNGTKLVGLPPHDQPYGMRDFRLADPDGNWLSFGRILDPAANP